MATYRRDPVAGGTYFFTATLVDRKSRALIDRVEDLRAAFRTTRRVHPFTIDAVEVFLSSGASRLPALRGVRRTGLRPAGLRGFRAATGPMVVPA